MNTSETLALVAQGKEAWNSWANQMLAEKSMIHKTSGQAEAGRAWADRARADFGGVNFNEDCDFACFVFPGEAEFWPALKKARTGLHRFQRVSTSE